MKTTFPVAKMDTAHTIVTAGFLVLLGAFVYIPLHQFKPMWGATAILLAVLFISWQMKPARYEVSDESVRIVRGWPFSDVVIPRPEIKDARRVKMTGTTLRTCGVGGLFGSGGWFWNKEIGRFFAAITNGYNLVLIEDGGKFVISPENPDEFADSIRSRL